MTTTTIPAASIDLASDERYAGLVLHSDGTTASTPTPLPSLLRRLGWWTAIVLCGWRGLWATTTAMLTCTALAWSNTKSLDELRRKRAAAGQAADGGT